MRAPIYSLLVTGAALDSVLNKVYTLNAVPARVRPSLVGYLKEVEHETPYLLSAVSLTILFLISCSHFPSTASPDTKAEVATLSAKWEQAFQEDNPDKIVALYAKDGVLWGTLSPKRRDDPAAIRDYFVGAFKALPGHKVTFGDQLIRVYGNTAINTGYYTVWYTKDGQTQSVPARYSFTYVKEGDKWLIADHHSSAMPSPPK